MTVTKTNKRKLMKTKKQSGGRINGSKPHPLHNSITQKALVISGIPFTHASLNKTSRRMTRKINKAQRLITSPLLENRQKGLLKIQKMMANLQPLADFNKSGTEKNIHDTHKNTLAKISTIITTKPNRLIIKDQGVDKILEYIHSIHKTSTQNFRDQIEQPRV